MSERLTTRLANGGVGYDNGEYFKVCYPWNEHCLTDIDRMAIKLCDLEDKMEQGKIVELKPCPFCGGKAKVKVCDGSGTFYTDIGTEMLFGRKMTHCLITCERCGVRTKAYLTRRGVFNAWNRRVNDGT